MTSVCVRTRDGKVHEGRVVTWLGKGHAEIDDDTGARWSGQVIPDTNQKQQ